MVILFLGGNLALWGGLNFLEGSTLGVSPLDAMLSDYQNTALFRQHISSQMGMLMDISQELLQGQTLEDWEEGWLETVESDENLLLRMLVPAQGGQQVIGVLSGSIQIPEGMPEGFNFWIQYRDGRFTAWKDGKTVDLDGLWSLPPSPGGPEAEGLVITLAAAKIPAAYRESGLYDTFQRLRQGQEIYLLGSLAAAAGGILLLWAAWWRKERAPLWAAAASFTGKICLEMKGAILLLLALPGLLGLPWAVYPLVWYGWVLAHDWRHNRRTLASNSLCARRGQYLRRRQGDLPVQQRMVRIARAALLTHLPYLAGLGAGAVWLWGWILLVGGGVRMTLLCLLLLLLLLLPVAAAWRIFRRQQANAGDLGLLLDQVAAGPGESGTARCPRDTDLARAWEQLGQWRSQMHRAVEEQVKSERMKVELISNVSHDLKTPITSILSYTQLLCQEEDLPQHVREYTAVLEGKAERLCTMVEEVFEVSKAASGAMEVRRERLDLRRLLEQTLADMAGGVADSGLTFRSDLPAGPVWILGDGDRLYRVFQNLIQNALQYALPGSRVYLRLNVQGDWAQATLHNIAREELPAGVDFTERFVRGDKSRTDGGSGLGLAIARTFTEACGGRFQVEVDDDRFTARTSLPLAAET